MDNNNNHDCNNVLLVFKGIIIVNATGIQKMFHISGREKQLKTVNRKSNKFKSGWDLKDAESNIKVRKSHILFDF